MVKWSYGFQAAKTLTPEASSRLIAEKVKAAVGRIREFRPFVLTKPITLDVRFKNYFPAELLAYLAIVERTDAHAIRFVSSDMIQVSKFLGFLTRYRPDLEP